MSLNCWLFSQVNLPTILLLMIIRSLAYCSYHHTLYKAAFTLGAQVQSSLGTNANAPFFFSSTPARIRARCRCPSTRSRPCSWAQKWELGPCLHTIFVSSGQSTALLLLLSSCFKMESNGAKWSNYVHSHISGTLSGSTAPFRAGTQALVPKHLVRTAPKV